MRVGISLKTLPVDGEEFDAVGVPFAERNEIMDEAIASKDWNATRRRCCPTCSPFSGATGTCRRLGLFTHEYRQERVLDARL
jgi:hypothetical protein